MKAALRGRFFIEAMTINKERKKAASGQKQPSAIVSSHGSFVPIVDIDAAKEGRTCR